MIPIFSPQKAGYRADNLSLVQTDVLNGSLGGVQFRDNGSTLYWAAVSNSSGVVVNTYSQTLSTPFDISSGGATTTTAFTVDSSSGGRGSFGTTGWLYLDAGTKVIGAEREPGGDLNVIEYTMSPAYTGTETEVARKTYAGIAYGPFLLANDGTRFVVSLGREIYSATFGTAYDVSTLGSLSLERDLTSDTSSNITAICWGRSEKQFFVVDGDENLLEYELTTAGDVSTSGAATSRSWSVPTGVATTHSIGFADNGRKFYAGGTYGIQEYDAVA